MKTQDPSKGYKGITRFVVEKEMGVKIAKKEYKLGIRASSTCEIGKAAQMIGLARGAYDHALPYLFQREQFGRFIGDFQ
ncbi:812_t:CDS:2, partial [Entrophospora sp. SA101]